MRKPVSPFSQPARDRPLLAGLVFFGLLLAFPGQGALSQIDIDGPRNQRNPFGVKAHLAWSSLEGETFYDDAAVLQALAMMREIGVGWVSFDVTWSAIEPERGEFDYSRYDELVRMVTDSGLNILATLIGTPDWASTAPPGSDPRTVRIHPPADPTDFGRFVHRTVTRYRHSIRYWEIWNEPNNRDFFVSEGSPWPRAVDYLPLIRSAYNHAKLADSGCRIVLGGLALNGMREAPDPARLTPSWLHRFYLVGGRPYFDVVNIHPYPYSNPVGSHLEQVRETRDVMCFHDDDAKSIWISEVNGNFFDGPNDNAASLSQIYNELKRELYVEKVFWYNFRNPVPGFEPPHRSQDTGLVMFDLTRKPAFYEFQNLVEVARRWWIERHGRRSQLRQIVAPLPGN